MDWPAPGCQPPVPRRRGREWRKWRGQQLTPSLPPLLHPPPLSRSSASQGCLSTCRSMRRGDLDAISISISISRRGRGGRGAPRICHVRGPAPARPAGRRPFGQGCAPQLACSGRASGSASATHGAAAGCGYSGRALVVSGGGPRGCGCASGGCGCAVGGCGRAARGCGFALWGCGCGCCGCSLRQRVPSQATRHASPDQQPRSRSRSRSRWQAPARSACRTVVTQAWMPSLVGARPRARAQTRVLRLPPVSAAPVCARPRRPRCCSETRQHRRHPPPRRLARPRRARVPALQPRRQPRRRLAFLLAHPRQQRRAPRQPRQPRPPRQQEQPRDSAPPQARQAAEAGARCASRSSSACNT